MRPVNVLVNRKHRFRIALFDNREPSLLPLPTSIRARSPSCYFAGAEVRVRVI